jgi:hypothetical protein
MTEMSVQRVRYVINLIRRIESIGRFCEHVPASHMKATTPPRVAWKLDLMPRVSRCS